MNKVTFIAQFPPPIHGLSKAVETLFDSELANKYLFRKVDITLNSSILKNLLRILFSKSDLYYFTISQTKGGNWRDLLILKLLRIKKARCLIHLHGGYYRTLIEKDCGKLQRKLNFKTINKVDGCIVLSNSLKVIFEGMIDKEKIHVVPNCVDDQYIISSEQLKTKEDFTRRINILNVLYLSNFIESKGYKEILQLALITKEQQGKFHFHFAGNFFNNNDKDYFFSFIKENDLSNYITFHGVVSGEKKLKLLNDCHIFTLLTRYPNEGQPIAILEALGNAMTIVTTNHAGIPDIVQEEKNGLILDKNKININLIYTYISELYKDREKLIRIGELNFAKINNGFSESWYILNIDRIFQHILHVND